MLPPTSKPPSTTSGALKATDLGASPTPEGRSLHGQVASLRILSSIFDGLSRKGETPEDRNYDRKNSQALNQLAEDLENGRKARSPSPPNLPTTPS